MLRVSAAVRTGADFILYVCGSDACVRDVSDHIVHHGFFQRFKPDHQHCVINGNVGNADCLEHGDVFGARAAVSQAESVLLPRGRVQGRCFRQKLVLGKAAARHVFLDIYSSHIVDWNSYLYKAEASFCRCCLRGLRTETGAIGNGNRIQNKSRSYLKSI